MAAVIRVQPAAQRRRDFARWAVSQTPKIRTVSPHEFAVPADLFEHVPEELLLDARVEGQPYVPAPQPEPQSEPQEAVREETASVQDDGRLVCGVCTRDFGSERALRSHQRQAHPDSEE
ncbi:hypothetical protein [Thermomonospora cellulosilytica]|uniref:C2H2-type domain-containing protein n=1 Tax=Thermomonospora cellulosilytica TaxID=1411118 RepID=A0A7W3N1S5_9ACTN|nr:hypothetical protein [Thermomonospora cellulosilytica]MBA9005949.1 hypothetical protein [Thermomonospora cellulosilytica]